jgi:undecaprenyl-diphosphatase
MIVCFVFFDASALSYLRENPPTWNKNFCVQAFKQLGKVYVPVWLLLSWAWITGKHKTAIVCFLSLLITMAAVLPVKALVRRPRPKDVIKAETKIENETKLSRSWSFPSGDTASVFAVGTVLAFAVRRPFILGLAACCGGIGILRVVELTHYPSDVFGGAALGILCGWSAIRIKNRYPGIENIFKGRERMLSFIGVILIPILIWRLQGIDKLIILLEFYAPIALIIAVVTRRQSRQT